MLSFNEWVLLENIGDKDMRALFRGANKLFGGSPIKKVDISPHFITRLQDDNDKNRNKVPITARDLGQMLMSFKKKHMNKLTNVMGKGRGTDQRYVLQDKKRDISFVVVFNVKGRGDSVELGAITAMRGGGKHDKFFTKGTPVLAV